LSSSASDADDPINNTIAGSISWRINHLNIALPK
jgi:hypothetical protein